MEARRLFESLEYKYTAQEKQELCEALAKECQAYFEVKEKKAAIMAEFTGQLKMMSERISGMTDRINGGFEMRPVECMYLFDTPRMGMKTLVECATSKEVRVEAMSIEELQSSLDFPSAGE